jgi:hypothetical protein
MLLVLGLAIVVRRGFPGPSAAGKAAASQQGSIDGVSRKNSADHYRLMLQSRMNEGCINSIQKGNEPCFLIMSAIPCTGLVSVIYRRALIG